jgi:chromosome segregation ATPase
MKASVPGVKEVLQKARAATEGPFCHVRGLVADLFDVSVEAAHLVEVALGEKAQHVAVAGGRDLLAYLQSEAAQFSGRVGFLWLDDAEKAATTETPDLERRARRVGASRSVRANLGRVSTLWRGVSSATFGSSRSSPMPWRWLKRPVPVPGL